MPDIPGDVGDAPLEEFMDPNSAIARIIAQMQGAATRSNPQQGDLPVQSVPQPGGAQPDPQELIRALLAQRR